MSKPEDLVKARIGQWVIDSYLGQGSYSDIYRGAHTESGTQAVIKVRG